MKTLDIRTAILLPVIVALAIGITIMVVILNSQASSVVTKLSEEAIDEAVNHYTSAFQAIGNENYGAVTTIAPIIAGLGDEANGREEAIKQFQDVIKSNKNMLGIWCAYEPNAFDGRDEAYKDAPYHDSTGRFVPYIANAGGNISVEPLADYDDAVAGDYYQGARKSGKPYVTDPYYYEVNGKNTLIFSITIPVLKNGSVIGAVGADIDLSKLIDTMNRASILEDGYIVTLSPSGFISTHSDANLIMSNYKDNWMGAFSAQFDKIAANGGHESGVAYSTESKSNMIYSMNGVQIGEAPQNWGIVGIIPLKTAEAPSKNLSMIIIISGIVIVLLISVIIFQIVKGQLKGLPRLGKIVETLAAGEVENVTFDNTSNEATRNEIVLLTRQFVKMVDSIKKQANVVELVAEGDLSIDVVPSSENDKLNASLKKMLANLNDMFQSINSATAQVSDGSKQIAEGAQSLALGSTEQAAAIQQLSSSIGEVAEKTKTNAQEAKHAAELSDAVRSNAEKGSSQMSEMIKAVQAINDASQDIQKVIKVIDDLAFQTNILALNAAVEAARAGSAGKGFAVVAEEVRSLAGKSADAAKDTSALIENSMSKAELGAKIAAETAASLNEIVAGINASSEIVDNIASSSEEQSLAITQINTGIDQVAHVVQQTSATSQESAATAEELSGQSTVLEDLVAQFKLKDTDRLSPSDSRLRLK
jgi:methyl-accepting chemotaxis protein